MKVTNHRGWKGALILALCLGTGLLVARPAAPRLAPLLGQETSSTVPAELTELVAQAVEAVNSRRISALNPLVTGEAARQFAWMETTPTRRWKGGVLPNPSPGQNPEYWAVFHAWHTCQSDGDHLYPLTQTEKGWRLGDERLETETSGFVVRDHTLRVTFDPPNHRAIIRDQARIERVSGEKPTVGILRLSSDFRVQQLRRDDQNGTPISYQQVGGILAFVAPPEKAFTLFLAYEGVVNHQGSDYILANEATLNSYWVPHSARLPATTTVTVTAPPGWTPLAQGELVRERTEQDGSLTLTFRNDIPTCYFTLNAGRYQITTRQVRGRQLAIYLLQPNADLAKRSLDLLEDALAFYEKEFSPFPYTRYALVETRGPFMGALEAYSFATYGPGALPETIPHELTHTWWGGLVPCAYTRSMWNEGFAEYSDSLFQRVAQNKAETGRARRGAESRPRRVSSNFARFVSKIPLSQAHDTSDMRQAAVGYEKGLRVLRVLEEEIGQETLLRCLRTFLADHPRGAAAEWPQFEAAVRKVTGKDYRWFFAQWVERAGLPRVRLAHITSHRDGNAFLLTGDIQQEDAPYRLRMPIQVEMSNGNARRETVRAQGASTAFRLRLPSAPTRLTLDPEGILPLVTGEKDETFYTFPP